MRIAAIADVHLSSLIGPWMLSRHVAAINELQPDLVVICGDLVDTNMTERDEDAALLRSLQTQHGAIAVTGNHENYRGLDMSLNFMEKAGLTVLRGQWMECGDIVVAGVDDDSFAGRFTPDTSDVARTLSSAPQDKFILLLRHQPHVNPDMIGQFDIQFSGHTHSGQLWPGMAFTRRIFGVGQGLTELTHGPHRSLLYVTNGIGYWGPPIRFLAPPEIVVFTLSPAE